MMGGRERKIGLQIRVVAALGPPQSTIHLAFELHQSPTRPTTTGLHENARWQFLQLSPRATRKRKGSTAWLLSSPALPLLRSSRLAWGRDLLLGPVQVEPSASRPLRRPQGKGRKKRKRWERWRNDNTQQSSKIETLTIPPFFFPDNVGDRYLAVTAMMHVSQPIANEWPIKPPFDNQPVLLATPQAS